MSKLRRYKCPDCAGEFDFLHHPDDEPPPAFCPICGANVGDTPVAAIVAPNVVDGTASKSADGVYRAMEASSAARAASFGQPNLKITDLPRTADQSALNARARALSFGQDRNNIAEFVRGNHAGPYALSGNVAREATVMAHGRYDAHTRRAGRLNK